MGLSDLFKTNADLCKKAEKTYRRAQASGNYTSKISLMQSCVETFKAGKPDDLRAFLTGYLEFKRASGQFKIDEGYKALVILPVLSLMEVSDAPADVLSSVTEEMSAPFRQFVCDAVLSVARGRSDEMVLKALMSLGADSNAFTGRPPQIDVFAMAARDCNYDEKEGLLQTCMDAFRNGQPEKMRQFIKGYISFKRGEGKVGMDAGYINLAADPLVALVEESTDAAATLDNLLMDISHTHRSVILNFSLRRAVWKGSGIDVVTALLDAGADINTCEGKPLSSAITNNHRHLISLLNSRGVNWDLTPDDAEADYMQRRDEVRASLKGSQQAKNPAQAAAAAPKPAQPGPLKI